MTNVDIALPEKKINVVNIFDAKTISNVEINLDVVFTGCTYNIVSVDINAIMDATMAGVADNASMVGVANNLLDATLKDNSTVDAIVDAKKNIVDSTMEVDADKHAYVNAGFDYHALVDVDILLDATVERKCYYGCYS